LCVVSGAHSVRQFAVGSKARWRPTFRLIKAKEAQMLYDFTEPERNVTRRALEIYLSDLREEIVKMER